MIFYTSDGCRYEGMDKETIVRGREELGRSTKFVTEEEYKAVLAALEVL